MSVIQTCHSILSKIPKRYSIYFCLVYIIWAIFVYKNNLLGLFEEHWLVSLTMVFGSLIAGASSEGGGAIAFPVFTMLLEIPPSVARNYSFAIQSIGMTAASLFIIDLNIKIDKKTIGIALLGGGSGLIFGTFALQGMVNQASLKLIFVSLWLSFSFALYLKNKNKNRAVYEEVKFDSFKDVCLLTFFAFLGGVLTSFFGSGVDIFTFCILTLHYNISESIATPTSVVIMTGITIIGFFLHVVLLQDFQPIAFEYWLCSIPIVIIFAPIGAYLITFLPRQSVFILLMTILVVQYIGALIILQPSIEKLLTSGGIIITGSIFFRFLSKQ